MDIKSLPPAVLTLLTALYVLNPWEVLQSSKVFKDLRPRDVNGYKHMGSPLAVAICSSLHFWPMQIDMTGPDVRIENEEAKETQFQASADSIV
ncbi:hypothetical protein OUZ56_027034 [Daphnia magna]|uniref:Uncharacterized protein n=1 Tax=Daphnia magna TaxID=35525 RepID=A0ABQ9ZNM3_9CRUS|nr:hypothetical protein OUZ56_027034 [Daphnia magna]